MLSIKLPPLRLDWLFMVLSHDEYMVKLAHDLPPEPVDDEKSSTRLLQAPSVDGADITTVGCKGAKGGCMTIIPAVTRGQDEHSTPVGHAARKSVPCWIFTKSPGTTLPSPVTVADTVFASSH